MVMIFGRKLRRNLQRRRLGGVCAGIADFLGIDVTWIRLAFLVSIFISFSLTFWIYLALWIFVPAKSRVAIPNVSSSLKHELRRMDRLVRKMHRKLEFRVADQAQDTFDAIKLLSSRFDKALKSRRNNAFSEQARLTWEQGMRRFNTITEELVAIPKDYAQDSADTTTPYQKLVRDLDQVHDSLIQTSVEILTEETSDKAEIGSDKTSRLRMWKKRYKPLRQRLSTRANPDTLDILTQIEEKLELLLGQENTSEFFDLKPFEVQKIAFEYIPDAIHEYLRLPPEMAKTRRLNNGKTAEESLKEQLKLLNNALDKLADSLFHKDAHGLLVHGRFLREKFTDHPFRVSDQ
jgi:phage shock protein PspC (stress-responsive transcriptional regulator)